MNGIIIFISIVVVMVAGFLIFVKNKKKPFTPTNLPKWYKGDYFTFNSAYLLHEADSFYSTDNEKFWSIQANTSKMPNTFFPVNNIMRIDIDYTGNPLPELNQTFSIEADGKYPQFHGNVFVNNGALSSANTVKSGIITFTPDSSMKKYVKGTYSIVLTDLCQWDIAGEFCFLIDKTIK